ncbi:RdgB/HAM1 family non-canonical purine NTP pyrophosphatase [Anaerolineales bacterium]
MLKLLIGSQNPGKIAEYAEMLSDCEVEILGLDAFNLGDMEVVEDGTSFEANAALKARAYAHAAGILALSDDSGLCVDALDGAPGIFSARYGGKKDAQSRRDYLLAQLQEIPPGRRQAHFVCVLSVAQPDGEILIQTRGECPGQILLEERDAGTGFGYDPLFLPDASQQSFAEMSSDEKNAISHRGLAVNAFKDALKAYLKTLPA